MSLPRYWNKSCSNVAVNPNSNQWKENITHDSCNVEAEAKKGWTTAKRRKLFLLLCCIDALLLCWRKAWWDGGVHLRSDMWRDKSGLLRQLWKQKDRRKVAVRWHWIRTKRLEALLLPPCLIIAKSYFTYFNWRSIPTAISEKKNVITSCFPMQGSTPTLIREKKTSLPRCQHWNKSRFNIAVNSNSNHWEKNVIATILEQELFQYWGQPQL